MIINIWKDAEKHTTYIKIRTGLFVLDLVDGNDG